MTLGGYGQEEGDNHGSVLADGVHGFPHLPHRFILKSCLLFRGWGRGHYLKLFLLLINNSYGVLALFFMLLESNIEIRLKVAPLNDKRLSINKTFLNVEVAPLADMSAHLFICLNNFIVRAKSISPKTESPLRCPIVIHSLIALHDAAKPHHHLVDYRGLNNIRYVDAISQLSHKGRLSHAFSSRNNDNKWEPLLIESCDHLVPLYALLSVSAVHQYVE